MRLRQFPFILLVLFLPGCFGMRPSAGGGQVKAPATTRPVNSADVVLSPGYRIEVVATGLNFPTGVAFDDQSRPCVVEAGYCYGEISTIPRLLRIEPGGPPAVIAQGKNGPWNGVIFHEGNFYVSQGGVTEGGAIVRIGLDGQITPLIWNLPS